MTAKTQPRIYVANLGAYSRGILHGAWIDAAQEPDEMQAEIEEMLASSPVSGSEEWAIHDQDEWGGIELDEHESLETVSQLAKLLAEHGPLFASLLAHVGGPQYLDEAVEAMTERYQGTFSTVAEWAENYANDTGLDCAEPWKNYIDYDQFGRDAEMGGDIFSVDVPDGVAIFTN